MQLTQIDDRTSDRLDVVARDCDFVRACFGKSVRRRPIWIMRQAGRYQASYRAMREKHSFAELCFTPELVARATSAPVDEFDFDAAIIFSDILVVFPAMGVPVSFDNGGPVLSSTIRSAADLRLLRRPDVARGLRFLADAIRQTRAGLSPEIPLIGFSGAPFTLACYAIEGATSRDFPLARRFFHEDPESARRLMSHLTGAVTDHLLAQIEAGVDAVQIFDSWGGLLSSADFRAWVLPSLQEIVGTIRRPGIPIILYINGGSHLLDILDTTRIDVLGIDWRTELNAAAHHLNSATAIQGNLDPMALFGSPETIVEKTRRILDSMDTIDKGHIFNLGHGIMPATPEENVRLLVQAVHAVPPKHT